MAGSGYEVFRLELSPTHYLERAGDVHAGRVAVVDGEVRYSWRELRARARRLAWALRGAGLGPGDRVAYLALDSEPLLCAHHGVPLAGGVLVAINTRLSAGEVAYIVAHAGARLLFHSPELAAQLAEVAPAVRRIALGPEHECFLAGGRDEPVPSWLADEAEPCAVHFKVPKAIELGELPKTSTGKVQKYVLREREWQGRAKRIN
jgi:fatty-acyl-CoA synthase